MHGIHTAFEGTIGRDADLRRTSTGKPVCSFNVAVGENRAGGDGAETTWVKCTIWEADAERLAATLLKGVTVYCEGKLKMDRWTGQDGIERTGLSASVWTCQPLAQIGRRAPKRDQDSDKMTEWDALGNLRRG